MEKPNSQGTARCNSGVNRSSSPSKLTWWSYSPEGLRSTGMLPAEPTSTVVVVGCHQPWSAIVVIAVIGSCRCCCQGSHSCERPHRCKGGHRLLQCGQSRGDCPMVMRRSSLSKLAAGGALGAPVASAAAFWPPELSGPRHCWSWSTGRSIFWSNFG